MVKFTKKQIIIMCVVAFYMVTSVGMNILTMKAVQIGVISVFTCGLLLTPFNFACNDILTECTGKKFAFKIILGGALCNLIWTILCAIAVNLPGNNPYISEAFGVILGSTWRITSASLIAYIGGGYINNIIMDKLHEKHGEKKYYIRAISSTALGQLFDDYVFCLLAFAPIGLSAIENPWSACLTMPLVSAIAETLIETVVTPLSKKVCDIIKK